MIVSEQQQQQQQKWLIVNKPSVTNSNEFGVSIFLKKESFIAKYQSLEIRKKNALIFANQQLFQIENRFVLSLAVVAQTVRCQQ